MIELTPQQQQFVEAQVAAGNFSEPAEVVQAALELLQQTAQPLTEAMVDIREQEDIAAIQAGIDAAAEGRVSTLEEADARIREKLGLPVRT